MSYLIKNNTVIAISSNFFKAGDCEYAFSSTQETINANFKKSLVNSSTAKISNAKKWTREASACINFFDLVDPHFERDFLVNPLFLNYE